MRANSMPLWKLISWTATAVVVAAAASADQGYEPTDVDDAEAILLDDTPHPSRRGLPDWFATSFLDLREDLTEAVDVRRKDGLIVYFHQDDCPYCEAFLKENLTRPDVLAYVRAHFDIVAADVWGSRSITDMAGMELTEREFAVRENLNFTPSFLIYDASGEEALRLRGYYPPYRFRAALEYVVDGHYKRESLRRYFERADPPPKFDLADLNERTFFSAPPFMLDRTAGQALRPLAVFFEQGECHSCDVLHSEAISGGEVEALIEQFEVVQLDMWADTPVITPDGDRTTARGWADTLDIAYRPTIVFFDATGHEIIRIDSVVRMFRLRGVLRYVLERGYERHSTFFLWRRYGAR